MKAETKPQISLNRIYLFILMAILAIRITSYFTLFPDSVGKTQVVKVGLRFFMTGVSLCLLLMAMRKYQNLQVVYSNLFSIGFYLLYLGLGITSLLWTTGVGFTTLQLAMTIESLFFSFFFYRLLSIFNHLYGRNFFPKLFASAVFWISLVFLYGLYADPETYYRDTHGGEVSRLGGYIINPNELGMLAVLGAVTNYLELREGRQKLVNLIQVGVAVAILLLTQSRSSLGAFLLVTGIFVLTSQSRQLKLAVVVGAFFVLPVVIQKIVLKQGNVEEVMSMTGRLPFWGDLIVDGFPERPLLGAGFMRISNNPFTNKFDSTHAYAASMTHNTFVQVLINLGLVGAFICLYQMLATFWAIATSKQKSLKLMAGAMLIPIMINSFTEFGIFGESNYGILFYQLIIFMFVIDIQEMSTTRKFRHTEISIKK